MHSEGVWGNKGTASLILNLDTGYRCTVNGVLQQIYIGEEDRYEAVTVWTLRTRQRNLNVLGIKVRYLWLSSL